MQWLEGMYKQLWHFVISVLISMSRLIKHRVSVVSLDSVNLEGEQRLIPGLFTFK